jgi:hypothetical protein
MSSSIQAYARVAGILFVLSIVGGDFGEAIAPSQVIVPGDAAATAHNIVSNNAFCRLGFAVFLWLLLGSINVRRRNEHAAAARSQLEWAR